MKLLLHLSIIILLIAFFFYTKLLPYNTRLYPKYFRAFNFFDKIFSVVLNALRSIFKPVVVGLNISIDTAQLALYVILILLLQIV